SPAAWRDLGRDLGLLHTRVAEDGPAGGLGRPGLPDPRPRAEELAREGYFSAVEERWLAGWLARLGPAATAPPPARFLHRDVQATNVMVRGDTLDYLAVLDWGISGGATRRGTSRADLLLGGDGGGVSRPRLRSDASRTDRCHHREGDRQQSVPRETSLVSGSETARDRHHWVRIPRSGSSFIVCWTATVWLSGPAENSSRAIKGRTVCSTWPSLKACCMASSSSSLAIAAMIIPWSTARMQAESTPDETSTETRNPSDE